METDLSMNQSNSEWMFDYSILSNWWGTIFQRAIMFRKKLLQLRKHYRLFTSSSSMTRPTGYAKKTHGIPIRWRNDLCCCRWVRIIGMRYQNRSFIVPWFSFLKINHLSDLRFWRSNDLVPNNWCIVPCLPWIFRWAMKRRFWRKYLISEWKD